MFKTSKLFCYQSFLITFIIFFSIMSSSTSYISNVMSRLLVKCACKQMKVQWFGIQGASLLLKKIHIFKYCTWQEVVFMYRFTCILC